MLRTLSIENFAVTKKADLEFKNGFCVLTGETGAGKSMIVDALSAVLGARSESHWVRTGTEKASVSAIFDAHGAVADWLEEKELNQDREVCVRRVIDKSGRSKAWINGTSVSIGELKDLGQLLAVIHGQHESVALLDSTHQRLQLDRFAQNEELVASVKEKYLQWSQAKKKLKEAQEEQDRLLKNKSALSWELELLEELAPQEGEWSSIEQLNKQLSQAQDITRVTHETVGVLSEDEACVLNLLDRRIRELNHLDLEALTPWVSQLSEAYDLIAETVKNIKRFMDQQDFSEEEVERVHRRMSQMHDVARKLRVSEDQLNHQWKIVSEKMATVEESLDVSKWEKEEETARAALSKVSQALSNERKKAAVGLSQQITQYLKDLGMIHSQLSIDVKTKDYALDGQDQVDFLLATHASNAALPLNRCASGGELARVGLALSVALMKEGDDVCMVFDEVDAGIGGPTGLKVGQMLAKIGLGGQSLAVTHLPQVAAFGSQHYCVLKSMNDETVESLVSEVKEHDRVKEIARMLGDEEAETAQTHAMNLLKEGSVLFKI